MSIFSKFDSKKERMGIDNGIVESLLGIALLSKMGEPCDGYSSVSTLNKASKSVRSMKWENICLECQPLTGQNI